MPPHCLHTYCLLARSEPPHTPPHACEMKRPTSEHLYAQVDDDLMLGVSSEQDSSNDLYDHLSLSVRKDATKAELYDHLNDLNPIAKIPNALKVMSSASFSAYDCLERFIRVDSVASEASSLYDKLNRDDRRIDYVAASPHSLEPAYENPKPYPALSLPTSSNYLADSSSVKDIANPHIGPVLAHYDVVDRGMVSSLVKSLPPVTALTLVSAWAPILVNDENPFEGSRSASDYEMAPTGGFSSLKGSSAGTNAHRPPAALTFNLGHHDEESLYDAMEGAAQPYDTMASFRSSNLAGDFDAKYSDPTHSQEPKSSFCTDSLPPPPRPPRSPRRCSNPLP